MDIEFEFPIDPQKSDASDKISRQDPAAAGALKGPPVRIDHDLCEQTGVCAELCPEDVLEFSGGHTHVARPEACTECWICVENCVSGAIEVV